MILKLLLRGILKKYFRPLYNALKKKGTGGTDRALYCYSVWLRHLVLLHQNGMKTIPKNVVEIGPGDSLGIGLNAILTGANKYYAFDIIEHTNVEKNLKIFDELVELYKQKLDMPNDSISPNTKPKLKNYDFPSHILTDSYLEKMLNDNRLKTIRAAIKNKKSSDFVVEYILPNDNVSISDGSIDLVFSQATMEHVDDVDSLYKKSFVNLKNGGFMSHQIDYSSHETHKLWYGHWQYSKRVWRLINFGRSYSINRLPNSSHVRKLKEIGFKVLFQLPFLNTKAQGIDKELFNENHFEEKDLEISSCFIISKKE